MKVPERRKRVHTRTITVEGFVRKDGLYEIEGSLIDVKDDAFSLPGVQRAPYQALHDMRLRLLVNADMQILEANVSSESAPTEQCKPVAAKYRGLVGLSMTQGFTRKVQERFGGTKGCTHHTELLRAIATTTFQIASSPVDPVDGRPLQLDKCAGVASDGIYVATYFPAWHRRSKPSDDR